MIAAWLYCFVEYCWSAELDWASSSGSRDKASGKAALNRSDGQKRDNRSINRLWTFQMASFPGRGHTQDPPTPLCSTPQQGAGPLQPPAQTHRVGDNSIIWLRTVWAELRLHESSLTGLKHHMNSPGGSFENQTPGGFAPATGNSNQHVYDTRREAERSIGLFRHF